MLATKLDRAAFRIFSTVLLIMASIAVLLSGYGLAEPTGQHWIEQQFRTSQYKLSQFEKDGLYLCSVREGHVIEVEFERGFVTIIFASAAPRFFKQTEISEAVLLKLTSVREKQLLNVLCVHSSYRDDWQARYDENLSVNHKLLDIIVVGQN